MPDKSRVAENKEKIILSTHLTDVRQEGRILPMPKTITFRPAVEDRRLIDRLASKLGIKTSQVLKIAIRRFAEAEGMKMRAS